MSHIIYLPVVPRLNMTSEERAKALNKELFNLQLPKHLHGPRQTTNMLLDCVKHPTTSEWALVADTAFKIKIHPQRDIIALVSLFPHLTQEERDKLTYHIASRDIVIFEDLIPSSTEVLDEAQAEAAGWFDYPFDE